MMGVEKVDYATREEYEYALQQEEAEEEAQMHEATHGFYPEGEPQ